MSCLQTLGGLLRDCEANRGGVKQVLLANFDDVSTVEVDSTSGKIDTITMATSKKFHRYYMRPEQASMASTLNVNKDNGTNYVSTILAMVFHKMDTTKRIEMTALSVAGLRALVQDGNGLWWLLGYDEPMYASAGDGNTGAKSDDRNGYTLSLEDKSQTFPYEILTGTGGVDIDSISE